MTSSLKQCCLITWIFLSLIIFTFSCRHRIQPQTSAQLYDKYKKAVVLIVNEYYYEISFSSGTKGYFTEVTNGEVGDLTFDEDEARRKANTTYGTAFFISRDGKLATNKHVLFPEINSPIILASLKRKFDNVIYKNREYELVTKQISEIENQKSQRHPLLDSQLITLMETKEKLNNERKLIALNGTEDFDPVKSKIKSKSNILGIAYDNSFINSPSNLAECVLIRQSEDIKIDLAIIQLKTKSTPQNIPATFDFENHNPNIKNQTLKKGEETDSNKLALVATRVYMIGFNKGLEAAITTKGLKAQLTEGSIVQETDKYKVMYSILSLQGSSGSPVIDEWGNLVAINYAKLSNSENFSYGILANHLRKLLMSEQIPLLR